MIPQGFINEIQTRTDIVELISAYIPLKRSGRNFKAICPFHGEKTPSFMVSPQKQIFHCFGCGEGGGIIQFLMMHEKVSFVEAVEILAKRQGLNIPYERSDKDKIKPRLYEAVSEAMQFFQNCLLKEEAAKPVLKYLKERGIAEKTIAQFHIGYACTSNLLLGHMRKKGFSLQALEKASLVISQRSGFKDLFRERIVFPIFDIRSRPIGFGGRIWKNISGVPKYINSLENPLYSKRNQLFGLNFAKDDIIKNDAVIVVEGYLDMIIPFMRGTRNIVASSGTALTVEQIKYIRRYTSNVILVFDSDKAGEMATMRTLDLLLENELKIKVAKLPLGFDPDSFVRKKGNEAFSKALSEAQDFFDYKMGVLKKIYDVESIEGKTKIAKELLGSLQKLKSEIEKHEYIKKLSQALKVKEEILIAELRKINSTPGTRNWQPPQQLGKREPLSLTEKTLLKFMVSNQGARALIKKNVKEEDFISDLARKTFSYLSLNIERLSNRPQELLTMIEDKEISRFISSVLMDDNIPLEKEFLKGALLKMRQRRIKVFKNRLKEEIRQAEQIGDRQKLKVLISEYGKIKSEAGNG
ncbi:MAG: DNA primase [Candidatus Omnitrophota bacterium]|nr:MAG: DNA primase [Candidatus Omnitrophota bacterium]